MLARTASKMAIIPNADQPKTFETLPDVARKFRAMATGIGAERFHLFAVTARGSREPLALLMDADFPGTEDVPRLPFAFPPPSIERIAAASTILWWEGPDGEPALAGLDGWSERIAVQGERAGLALPVCSERGQPGVVVFSGNGIEADREQITAVHARCYYLFGVVSGVRPVEQALPTVSRRELECLKLTANGLTSDEIARHLGLSVHTANQYLANTVQKLDAVNRPHAVAKAIRSGLIG